MTPAAADTGGPVNFYVPFRSDGVRSLPTTPGQYWEWMLRQRGINEGKYSWTLQTFLHLSAAGFDCVLTDEFPKRGIVVAHRDFLPVFLLPRAQVFLVCLKPDRREHTWAHYYIVQNPRDAVFSTPAGMGRTTSLPLWPQPGLTTRDPARAETCRNVIYAGREGNLAPELRVDSWAARLDAAGFKWNRRPLERWHDASDADVIVGVRSFVGRDATDPIYAIDSKPPSKLINAWLAGVPAVLGIESAYRGVREHELDYLEVATPDELLAALERLRADPALYRAMVAHGRRRAAAFTPEALTSAWIRTLTVDVREGHESWRRQGELGRMRDNIANMLKYFSKADNLRSLLTIFK
jgi:hypothetical protein